MMLSSVSKALKSVLGGVALSAVALSAAHAAPLYVYKGNGSDGRKALPAFEQFIGRKVDGVVDFVAYDSWASFDSDAAWGIGGWKGSGYKLAESVPLTVAGTSLADVAAGKQDAHFVKLAQTLVSNGFPDAYLRLGWEFNGGWYPWAFKGREKDFSAAFRHVATLMRGVSGSKFKIVWNPALYEQQQWPDWVYPGDDVIDVIATDAYNQSWDAGYTDANRRWSSVLNDSWGVNDVVKFAKKHSKPYAFPEWATGTRPDGHGGGDDPTFIANMAPIVAGSAFSGYWDYPASDYNGQISTNKYPNAAKQFLLSLKPVSTPAPTPAPTPTPTASKVTATVSDGGSASLAYNSDGSAVLNLSFPKTATSHHYTIWLSATRKVYALSASGGAGALWGSMKQLGWDTTGGSGKVFIGAN